MIEDSRSWSGVFGARALFTDAFKNRDALLRERAMHRTALKPRHLACKVACRVKRRATPLPERARVRGVTPNALAATSSDEPFFWRARALVDNCGGCLGFYRCASSSALRAVAPPTQRTLPRLPRARREHAPSPRTGLRLAPFAAAPLHLEQAPWIASLSPPSLATGRSASTSGKPLETPSSATV